MEKKIFDTYSECYAYEHNTKNSLEYDKYKYKVQQDYLDISKVEFEKPITSDYLNLYQADEALYLCNFDDFETIKEYYRLFKKLNIYDIIEFEPGWYIKQYDGDKDHNATIELISFDRIEKEYKFLRKIIYNTID